MVDRKTLGRKIRDLRLQQKPKKWTLQGLADRVGVEYSTVWRWEHGEVDIEKENLRALADAFNISYEEIAGEGAPIPPSPDNIATFVQKLADENRFLKTELAKGIEPQAQNEMEARERAKLQKQVDELEAELAKLQLIVGAIDPDIISAIKDLKPGGVGGLRAFLHLPPRKATRAPSRAE